MVRSYGGGLFLSRGGNRCVEGMAIHSWFCELRAGMGKGMAYMRYMTTLR